jgi:hypothetical protein
MEVANKIQQVFNDAVERGMQFKTSLVGQCNGTWGNFAEIGFLGFRCLQFKFCCAWNFPYL